jgi:DNA-binding protein Fis
MLVTPRCASSEMLGVSERTIHQKLKKLGLS